MKLSLVQVSDEDRAIMAAPEIELRSRRAPTWGPLNPSLLPRPDPIFPGNDPSLTPEPVVRTIHGSPPGSPSRRFLSPGPSRPTPVENCQETLKLSSERGHTGVVSAVLAHGQGTMISCGGEGTVIRWTLPKSSKAMPSPSTRIAELTQPRALAIGFDPNEGLCLFVGCHDGHVFKYELESMAPLPFLVGDLGSAVTGLCVEEDVLIATLQHGSALSLELASGELLNRFENSHSQQVQSPIIHGGRLFIASNDCTVSSWNLDTGAMMHKFLGHADQVKVCRSVSLFSWTA